MRVVSRFQLPPRGWRLQHRGLMGVRICFETHLSIAFLGLNQHVHGCGRVHQFLGEFEWILIGEGVMKHLKAVCFYGIEFEHGAMVPVCWGRPGDSCGDWLGFYHFVIKANKNYSIPAINSIINLIWEYKVPITSISSKQRPYPPPPPLRNSRTTFWARSTPKWIYLFPTSFLRPL